MFGMNFYDLFSCFMICYLHQGLHVFANVGLSVSNITQEVNTKEVMFSVTLVRLSVSNITQNYLHQGGYLSNDTRDNRLNFSGNPDHNADCQFRNPAFIT